MTTIKGCYLSKGDRMSTVVKSPGFTGLVDPRVSVEKLAGGFGFTEGPIWHPAEECLYFSDMPNDVRRRWSERDGVTEVKRPSNKCNGMTYDAEHNLVVCEHSTSRLVRERRGGELEILASHYKGAELNSPNDVCVHSDGFVYFTDPTFGRMPGFGIERPEALDFRGLYRVSREGGDPELIRSDFDQPNGLCFSPDESLLYVNDTSRAHIRVFRMGEDGAAAEEWIFAEGIGTGEVGTGVVDGMKCDELGNVWVTGPGGIWVFDPSGQHLGIVEIPEDVGNFHWGGRRWADIYVCASTSLYRFPARVRGRQEPFMHTGADYRGDL